MAHQSPNRTEENTMKMPITNLSPTMILTCLCACVITASSCSDDPGPGMTSGDGDQGASMKVGEEGAPCYGNGTCNAGLQCVEEVCAPEDISSPDDMGSSPIEDAGNDLDSSHDMTTSPDASTDMRDEVDMEDMGPPSREAIEESEPNNGEMLDEVNTLAPNQIATGAIATPGDVDVWKVDIQPGEIYRIELVAGDDSLLEEHLTVIDAGRGSDPAGDDYVKIAQQLSSVPHASLTLLGMGEGGYFLIVRDTRNVGAQMSQEGSAAHTYTLSLQKLTLSDVRGKALAVEAGEITDALSSPGDISIYPFTASLGDELVADLQAASAEELDARLFVYAEQEKSWIARQDNRTIDDVNPLLDAPLFADGQMWLIVENITPTATSLAYTLKTTLTKQ